MCRAINIAFSSLRSHMQYAVYSPKSTQNTKGGEYWNAKTIREYAEIILICSWELEYLNLKRRKTSCKPKDKKGRTGAG
jgi:hypothetical protein